MTGRNDPCPCGSGKKYKKCCLPKDRAARIQTLEARETPELPETAAPLDYYEPELTVKPAARGDSPPAPEVDPLLQRINAFWEQFMDAPYEKQWSLVTQMLAEEPELCDGEMVFEIANTLFERAIAAGELERYQQLLNQLEQTVPEAYAEELHYILDRRIQMALIEENEAHLEHYFYRFSPLAGDHLDIYSGSSARWPITGNWRYYIKGCGRHGRMWPTAPIWFRGPMKNLQTSWPDWRSSTWLTRTPT